MSTPVRHDAAATMLLLASVFACPAAQAQNQAHVHGLATLDIAVDGSRISLMLVSPLDNLLGFEREPATDAEAMRAKSAIGKLRDGATLFRFDPRARCTLAQVVLEAPLLKLGQGKPDASGHGSMVATYAFECADVAQATMVELGWFDAFSRMQRIKIQVATPQGQFMRALDRPAGRLELRR